MIRSGRLLLAQRGGSFEASSLPVNGKFYYRMLSVAPAFTFRQQKLATETTARSNVLKLTV
jgi:hypothetical protein